MQSERMTKNLMLSVMVALSLSACVSDDTEPVEAIAEDWVTCGDGATVCGLWTVTADVTPCADQGVALWFVVGEYRGMPYARSFYEGEPALVGAAAVIGEHEGRVILSTVDGPIWDVTLEDDGQVATATLTYDLGDCSATVAPTVGRARF